MELDTDDIATYTLLRKLNKSGHLRLEEREFLIRLLQGPLEEIDRLREDMHAAKANYDNLTIHVTAERAQSTARIQTLETEASKTDRSLVEALQEIEAYRTALEFIANGHPEPAKYARILLAIGKD